MIACPDVVELLESALLDSKGETITMPPLGVALLVEETLSMKRLTQATYNYLEMVLGVAETLAFAFSRRDVMGMIYEIKQTRAVYQGQPA